MKETKDRMPMTPDKLLEEAAALFHERSLEYGNSYLSQGAIMKAFFPEGITLESEEDFGNFHIFELMVIKLNRMARGLERQDVHTDSYRDTSVYGAMGIHLDEYYSRLRRNRQDAIYPTISTEEVQTK